MQDSNVTHGNVDAHQLEQCLRVCDPLLDAVVIDTKIKEVKDNVSWATSAVHVPTILFFHGCALLAIRDTLSLCMHYPNTLRGFSSKNTLDIKNSYIRISVLIDATEDSLLAVGSFLQVIASTLENIEITIAKTYLVGSKKEEGRSVTIYPYVPLSKFKMRCEKEQTHPMDHTTPSLYSVKDEISPLRMSLKKEVLKSEPRQRKPFITPSPSPEIRLTKRVTTVNKDSLETLKDSPRLMQDTQNNLFSSADMLEENEFTERLVLLKDRIKKLCSNRTSNRVLDTCTELDFSKMDALYLTPSYCLKTPFLSPRIISQKTIILHSNLPQRNNELPLCVDTCSGSRGYLLTQQMALKSLSHILSDSINP